MLNGQPRGLAALRAGGAARGVTDGTLRLNRSYRIAIGRRLNGRRVQYRPSTTRLGRLVTQRSYKEEQEADTSLQNGPRTFNNKTT